MAYRLVELEFEPSILVCYGPHGFKWRVASKSVDYRWSWPRRLLDPQSNAYAILYEDGPDDRIMSNLEADTWFDMVGAENIEVGEQSFRSGDEVYALLVLRSDRMLAD